MNDAIVIKAVSRGVMCTLVDGTIRVKIDIEPEDAAQAFALLGMPGSPVAVAALVIENTGSSGEPPKPPKGGELSKLAAMFCENPIFQEWLSVHFPSIWTSAYITSQTTHPSDIAAEVIRRVCHVTSRAVLDHDEHAAEIFHMRFRQPFVTYQQEHTDSDRVHV